MKYILVVSMILALMLAATPVKAQGHPCDPYAPYYTKIQTGPGALLADLFLFGMSAPVAVAVAGGRRRPVINPQTGEVRHVSTAACVPIATARHFVQNRPPHVEHWRAYD